MIMKKIIAGVLWMLIGVNAMSAQTEVTPDMIWREGVTFVREFTNITTHESYEDNEYKVTFDTLVYYWEYVLTPINVEGKTFLVDYNTMAEWYEHSFRREENGKMYGFVFNVDYEGVGYAILGDEAEVSRDGRDGSMGKEFFMHDFNTWIEGDSVEWTRLYSVGEYWDKQLETYLYQHNYKTNKEKITKLEKIESPDGNYWMWGYQNNRNECIIKGLGSLNNTFDSYDVVFFPLEHTYGLTYKVCEVRSPEGEVYYRHPDYMPEDELGALDMVTPDNHVNIICNADEVTVTSGTPVEVEIFTAQGMKVFGKSAESQTVCKLQPGLYIVRAGSTVKKVAVK